MHYIATIHAQPHIYVKAILSYFCAQDDWWIPEVATEERSGVGADRADAGFPATGLLLATGLVLTRHAYGVQSECG